MADSFFLLKWNVFNSQFYFFLNYYYYYYAFGPLRPSFTPGLLFSSFLLIVLVPLIHSHFQLLFSSFLEDERKETLARTCPVHFPVCPLCYCPTIVLLVLLIKGLLFSFLFCRSNSLSVPASSLLSCPAQIA